MAAIGNKCWVWDPTWLSYALGQPKRLKSCARSTKGDHHFACLALYIVKLLGLALTLDSPNLEFDIWLLTKLGQGLTL